MIIGRQLSLRPRACPNLAEVGLLCGQPGRSRGEFARRYPEVELLAEMTESGWTGGRLEGDPINDDVLGSRHAKTVLGRLRAASDDVCGVTHPASASFLTGAARDPDPERVMLSVEPGARASLVILAGGGVGLEHVSLVPR